MGIAENIRTLRKEQKLTQKQLGELLNIPFRTIMNWERGVREPSSQNMVLLENFFNVSGAFLRGETSDRGSNLIWEDENIINTIDDEMTNLLQEIVKHSRQSSEKNKKMTFDILVELRHILKLKDENHKEMTLDTLQINIFSLTRFVDIYRASLNNTEFEIGRLTRAKDLAVNSLSDSLDKMIDQLRELE